MPSRRISFTNFNRRLHVAGGREQAPSDSVRRASGVAPELTNSVLSRWGSTQLNSGINAIQLYYWNGNRYAYDGANLYENGASIKAGFNGTRLTFNAMAPQPGLQDYLFILGGGLTPFKISPTGNISNWGIVAPPNAMNASNVAQESIIVDDFNASHTNWTPTNCSVADESTIVAVGTGSLKVSAVGGPWHIINNSAFTVGSAPIDLGNYAGGDLSLPTDVVSFWVFDTPTNPNLPNWLRLDFDVNDGSFKKDYYSIVIQFSVPGSTTPVTQVNPALIFNLNPNQWFQVFVPKQTFTRIGGNLWRDWTNVVAVRISGDSSFNTLYLDNLEILGGAALGQGPAVFSGGSEYDYYTVFRNLVTGSQSNGQSTPSKVFGVAVNKVGLTQIPVSSDPQVGARDLYRTQALNQPGGGLAFYLDTIYDNSTTTYTDIFADTPVPETLTPWMPNNAVPPNSGALAYYVDGGNGYYFKLTTAGTTGANPPQWKVPTTQWSALSAFLVGETVGPLKAAGQFWQVTTPGNSGQIEPNWAGFATPGDTITDGTVVWTNLGLMTTPDNTAVWTYQGINSTPVLSSIGLLFDNTPPAASYGDAFGPFLGSMFWTRDSSAGNGGYVYASPPGRPEGVGQSYLVSTTNDPMQKVIEWDGFLWGFSQAKAFQANGAYPTLTFPSIDDALGTLQPFTVVAVQILGILYWAPDGIRVLNFSGSYLLSFESLAPIFRGQPEENVPAWNETTGPVWAEHARNEILFSDGTTLTLGLSYDGILGQTPVWRLPGPILTAAYYEHQTGELQAAFGGKIYLFEQPGVVDDGGNPAPFELQSPGDMPDAGQQFVGERLLLTVNTNVSGTPQNLVPTLIIDGVENILPSIQTPNGRATIDLPIYNYHGRLFDGIRLTGALTGRVEIFRLEATIWLGDGRK